MPWNSKPLLVPWLLPQLALCILLSCENLNQISFFGAAKSPSLLSVIAAAVPNAKIVRKSVLFTTEAK